MKPLQIDAGVFVTNVMPGPVKSEITKHALQASGEAVGTVVEDSFKRVSAERCAALMAAAAWAKLQEVWISPQPILMFCYIYQYLPSLYVKLAPNAGASRIKAFRTGDTGYNFSQNLGNLFKSKSR